MKLVLSLLLACLAASVAAGAGPVSPTVQVGVNYGPGRSTMISGVVVGEGKFVLTQADVLEGAREIAVAFTDREVMEPAVERVYRRGNAALLRLPEVVKAEMPLLREFPPGQIKASVVGAPSAFEIAKLYVRLAPIQGAARWRISPELPPAFRGAPIVSISCLLYTSDAADE